MAAAVIAARVATRRLLKPGSIVGISLALLAVVMVSLLQRRATPHLAADRALTGVVFGFALPLLAYGTVARVLDGSRVDAAVAELARHGASRRSAATGFAAVLVVALAAMGAVLAAVCVIVTRAPADPRLFSDLVTSSWIGVLAGTAYAGSFLVASTVGAKGGGRFWLLVLDWVLGAGTTAVALPWPRGHVRNLLGAEPVMTMPQWSASVALVLLTLACMALTFWRAPR